MSTLRRLTPKSTLHVFMVQILIAFAACSKSESTSPDAMPGADAYVSSDHPSLIPSGGDAPNAKDAVADGVGFSDVPVDGPGGPASSPDAGGTSKDAPADRASSDGTASVDGAGGANALDGTRSDGNGTTSDGGSVDTGPSFLSWSAATRIDNDPAYSVTGSQIAVDGNGNVMAVWMQSDGYMFSYRVYASLYSAGAWGAPVLLNPDAGSDKPLYPVRVAADGLGNFFVVWSQAWRSVNGIYPGIYGRRYVSGSGWEPAVTTIHENRDDLSKNPTGVVELAADAKGNATIAWGGSEAAWNHIYVAAARYTVGKGWDASQNLSTDKVQTAYEPGVAMDAAGNAMVVWSQSVGTSNSIPGIHAAVYTVGSGWKGPEAIEPKALAEKVPGSLPQVGFDPSGNALVVWNRSGEPGIYANRWTSANGWGTAMAIAGTSASSSDEGVRLAIDNQGNAMAVWNQKGGSLLASRYASGGTWSSSVLVDPDNIDYSGRIAVGPAGTAVALWVQSSRNTYNVLANRYLPGSGWGVVSWEKSMVSKTVSPNAGEPNVVIDKSGTATAVWWQEKCLYAARASVAGF